MPHLPALVLLLLTASSTVHSGDGPPELAWNEGQALRILEKTGTVRLAPDLSALTPAERSTVAKLIEVGQIFQDVYEDSRHRQALAIRARLQADRSPLAEQQRTLYRMFQGPIAVTLDNDRLPFVPGAATVVPGKNLYPWGISKASVQAAMDRQPELRSSLLDTRTAVRAADAASLKRDLDALTRYPVLAGLHPGLAEKLRALARKPDASALYAVPYAVAYAPQMVKAHGLLWEAAQAIAPEDPELAGYLRHRARDLLSNDYEPGDAAWVTGRFKRLNAQIGAYEVYDDELFGVKAFYSLSVMLRDEAATARLAKAFEALQAFEDSLPSETHKAVSANIPVGVYDVVADFGQARGLNTASILPNDPLHARRYGRTILLRANVMLNPEVFANGRPAWEAVVAEPFRSHLAPMGAFNRTLWHEVGHYLGPDLTASGRPVSEALEETASALEEMKADLVSLYLGKALRERGFYTDAGLRELYASGIWRLMQVVRPRRDESYGTMQLAQMNFFLQQGLLEHHPDGLHIHYERYHEVVGRLLREVIALQRAGDKAAADRFLDKYAVWDEAIQGTLAARMAPKMKFRFAAVRYGALGD
jgi:hypothetical protein